MNYDTSNLTRYIECAMVENKLIKKAEEGELRESINKCTKEAIRIKEAVGPTSEGWWVPISFSDKKNGNGRNYNHRLWENVINNQRDEWVGAPMLADHPAGDSDGSPANICGVWLDAKIDKPLADGSSLVYGLLVPSGSLGRDLKDHLKHGLKVGTSSSGFGKILPDGVTVDPDSFRIERLADWVLNPSQGTYFSYDESSDTTEDVSNQPIKESLENHKEEIIKEKFVADSIVTKFEEKKFRKDMLDFLKDADNMKDPQERLEEFKNIKSFLKDGVCSDLKEQIEQKIAKEEAFIKRAVGEKLELQEDFKINSPRELKEKLTKIEADTAFLDKEASDWKKVSEKLQLKINEASEELGKRPTQAYVDYLRERNALLQKTSERKLAEATKAIDKLTADAQSNTTKLTEAENVSETKASEISKLEEEAASLKEQLSKALDAAVRAKKVIRKYRESSKHSQIELKKVNDLLAEKTTELENKMKESSKKVNNLTKKLEKSVDSKELATLRNKLSLAAKANHQQRVSLEEAFTKMELAEKKLAEKEAQIHRLTSEKKQLLEARKADVEVKREARVAKRTPVQAFYCKLKEAHGAGILPFREKLLKAKSLEEAKRIYFSEILQKLPESEKIDEMRLPESLVVSPEQRRTALGTDNFKKAGFVDRLPKGWK